jgi:hypothetical protein
MAGSAGPSFRGVMPGRLHDSTINSARSYNMHPHDQARIEKIALHCYDIDPKRLSAATRLHTSQPLDRRFVLDTRGQRTRIVRSDSMEVLLRAYVTRRAMCTGRLLVLFERLREEVRSQPASKTAKALSQWQVSSTGAVVQLATSVGGEGFTQAAHTAPCQILVAGHYPWTWAADAALKHEFVTWFSDIYVMPDLVNETDSFIERESPGGLDNRGLFAQAVSSVLKREATPWEALQTQLAALRARIATSPEYLFDGVHKDWVLGVYLESLNSALPMVKKVLQGSAQ